MSTRNPADEIQQLRTRIARFEEERQVVSEIIENSPAMISIVRSPDFVYELVIPAFKALAPGKDFLAADLRTCGQKYPIRS